MVVTTPQMQQTFERLNRFISYTGVRRWYNERGLCLTYWINGERVNHTIYKDYQAAQQLLKEQSTDVELQY